MWSIFRQFWVFSIHCRSGEFIRVRETINQTRKIVGVISDTHGLLRPEVPELFRDVEIILHAGDIGSYDVVEQLRLLAPVIAVRGNNDTGAWAKVIPETAATEIAGVSVYILHDIKMLALHRSAGHQVIVSGHSHKPSLEWRDGILFLNPGSAGPRRFKLPVTLARLIIEGAAIRGELIDVIRRFPEH